MSPTTPTPTPDQQQQDMTMARRRRQMETMRAIRERSEMSEVKALLMDPKLLVHVVADVAALGVADEQRLVATIYLIGTSRLLDHPLSGRNHGATSTGKSWVTAQVVRLFPPDQVIAANDITPQGLYYMPPGSLRHKFVTYGERSKLVGPEAEDATRAWRQLVSEGRLDKYVTVKEKGKFATMHVQQDGPIAFIESTTTPQDHILDEDVSRCINLDMTQAEDHTRSVLLVMAERRSQDKGNEDRIIRLHRAVQGMLKPRSVVIPFAKLLGEKFPCHKPVASRAFGQVLSMVEASALLHQYQRQTDEQGRIVAEAYDYQVAFELLSGPTDALLFGARSERTVEFYWEVMRRDLSVGAAFTIRDLMSRTSLDKRTAQRHLNRLAEWGWAEEGEPAKGNIPATWILRQGAETAPCRTLPPPSVLDAMAWGSGVRHRDNCETSGACRTDLPNLTGFSPCAASRLGEGTMGG